MVIHAKAKTRSGQSNSFNRHGYVYLTTFTRPTDLKKFYYVGQHQSSSLDRKYLGSGRLLHYKINKYGAIGNVNVKILHWTYDQDELNLLEFMCIQVAQLVFGDDCLNLNEGGVTGTGRHSEKTKRKMSLARAGVPKPFISEALKGRPLKDAHRAKIKAAHNTPETRLKKSIALKGILKPGVSLALKGVPHSIFKCPTCGTKGGRVSMMRWHGEAGDRC